MLIIKGRFLPCSFEPSFDNFSIWRKNKSKPLDLFSKLGDNPLIPLGHELSQVTLDTSELAELALGLILGLGRVLGLGNCRRPMAGEVWGVDLAESLV